LPAATCFYKLLQFQLLWHPMLQTVRELETHNYGV
jgi:hypothetical protein